MLVQQLYGGSIWYNMLCRPLMEWLNVYTFPRENLHADSAVAFAHGVQLAQRLVSNGTTSALFFGSLHLEGCKALTAAMCEVSMPCIIAFVTVYAYTCQDHS